LAQQCCCPVGSWNENSRCFRMNTTEKVCIGDRSTPSNSGGVAESLFKFVSQARLLWWSIAALVLGEFCLLLTSWLPVSDACSELAMVVGILGICFLAKRGAYMPSLSPASSDLASVQSSTSFLSELDHPESHFDPVRCLTEAVSARNIDAAEAAAFRMNVAGLQGNEAQKLKIQSLVSESVAAPGTERWLALFHEVGFLESSSILERCAEEINLEAGGEETFYQ